MKISPNQTAVTESLILTA